MTAAASDNSGENPRSVRGPLSKKSERVCDPAHGAVRSRREAESY
jgi:hypothetical protein